MVCEYCGKELDEDDAILGEDDECFCVDTDCIGMYYYEKEKQRPTLPW